jgi:hypothetical protein
MKRQKKALTVANAVFGTVVRGYNESQGSQYLSFTSRTTTTTVPVPAHGRANTERYYRADTQEDVPGNNNNSSRDRATFFSMAQDDVAALLCLTEESSRRMLHFILQRHALRGLNYLGGSSLVSEGSCCRLAAGPQQQQRTLPNRHNCRHFFVNSETLVSLFEIAADVVVAEDDTDDGGGSSDSNGDSVVERAGRTPTSKVVSTKAVVDQQQERAPSCVIFIRDKYGKYVWSALPMYSATLDEIGGGGGGAAEEDVDVDEIGVIGFPPPVGQPPPPTLVSRKDAACSGNDDDDDDDGDSMDMGEEASDTYDTTTYTSEVDESIDDEEDPLLRVLVHDLGSQHVNSALETSPLFMRQQAANLLPIESGGEGCRHEEEDTALADVDTDEDGAFRNGRFGSAVSERSSWEDSEDERSKTFWSKRVATRARDEKCTQVVEQKSLVRKHLPCTPSTRKVCRLSLSLGL